MDKLIFATNNQNKVDEISKILGDKFKIITLKDAGINIDIPEPHNTLEANATEKSTTIYKLTKQNCFSEDTGLEVEELNGEPGVKSARYAGENRDFDANINKVLTGLVGKKNRRARFRTVISLILNDIELQFEGICNGEIINAKIGENGFGYDSIFVPEGSNRSFAQMQIEEKNEHSHRKKAFTKMIKYLMSNKIL